MDTFSANLKKIKFLRIERNFTISIVLIALLALFSLFINIPLRNGSMGWNPEHETMAKIVFSTFIIVFIFLLYTSVRLLILFNQFINRSIENCDNMTIKIDDSTIQIITNGSTNKLLLDKVELNIMLLKQHIRALFLDKEYWL